MNKQTEALKMAIDWIEKETRSQYTYVDILQACKEALEQPAQEYLTRSQQVIRANNSAQEPVAWGKVVEGRFSPSFSFKFSEQKRDGYTPLYTHPAPSWQGLSDDEIWDCVDNREFNPDEPMIAVARAIEQALKEKNT